MSEQEFFSRYLQLMETALQELKDSQAEVLRVQASQQLNLSLMTQYVENYTNISVDGRNKVDREIQELRGQVTVLIGVIDGQKKKVFYLKVMAAASFVMAFFPVEIQTHIREAFIGIANIWQGK